MIQEEIKVRVLIPTEGYKLTQASEVNIEDRIISDKIYLAVNDEIANWKEITIAEAETIKAEQERLSEDSSTEIG